MSENVRGEGANDLFQLLFKLLSLETAELRLLDILSAALTALVALHFHNHR